MILPFTKFVKDNIISLYNSMFLKKALKLHIFYYYW